MHLVLYPDHGLTTPRPVGSNLDADHLALVNLVPVLPKLCVSLAGYALAVNQLRERDGSALPGRWVYVDLDSHPSLQRGVIAVWRDGESLGENIPVSMVPHLWLDPVILDGQGRVYGQEGCLSLPELFLSFNRFEAVRVQCRGLDGRHYNIDCTGLLARVAQHEVDHLDGKLIIDDPTHMRMAGDKVHKLLNNLRQGKVKPGKAGGR